MKQLLFNTLSSIAAFSILFAGQSSLRAQAPVVKEAVTKTTTETTPFKAGALTLQIPKAWKSVPPKNKFRVGQFEISPVKEDKEVAVLAVFPPMGGTVDANLQRWVRQFSGKDLKKSVTTGTSTQGTYYLVDLTGSYQKPVGPPFQRRTVLATGQRMLAVLISTPGKGNYFMKLVGDEKTVTSAAKQFRNSYGADVSKEKKYEIK